MARGNLLREGIEAQKVHVTGNTVIDALQWVVTVPPDQDTQEVVPGFDLPDKLNGSGRPLILVTAHRRENHGQPIEQICRALSELARTRPEYHIVYPVHRNPHIWEPVHRLLGDVSGITLTPPIDYLSLVHLMKHSKLILTDSGGIQEEAPSLGVPVLVLRQTTERPEAVEAGTVKLVGTEPDHVVAEVNCLLDNPDVYESMARATNPYGDGRAAERIVDVLLTGQCTEFVAKA
jgi:UDP-N-acetylglucosamine 2-epimerase (non-hydrolysing)